MSNTAPSALEKQTAGHGIETPRRPAGVDRVSQWPQNSASDTLIAELPGRSSAASDPMQRSGEVRTEEFRGRQISLVEGIHGSFVMYLGHRAGP